MPTLRTIQLSFAETRAYTPGNLWFGGGGVKERATEKRSYRERRTCLAFAQPSPQETMPMRKVLVFPPIELVRSKGPPLSPWHASLPPIGRPFLRLPAQIIFGVIRKPSFW